MNGKPSGVRYTNKLSIKMEIERCHPDKQIIVANLFKNEHFLCLETGFQRQILDQIPPNGRCKIISNNYCGEDPENYSLRQVIGKINSNINESAALLEREKKSYEKDSNIFVDWVEGINKRDLKTAAQQEQFEATKTRWNIHREQYIKKIHEYENRVKAGYEDKKRYTSILDEILMKRADSLHYPEDVALQPYNNVPHHQQNNVPVDPRIRNQQSTRIYNNNMHTQVNRNQNKIVPYNVRQQQNVHPGMRHPNSNNNIVVQNEIMGSDVPPHFTNNNVHENSACSSVHSQPIQSQCR